MTEKTQTEALFHQSIVYVHSDDLLEDSRNIIESARHFAYKAVNTALVQRNWLLGKRIAEEELDSSGRAEYGKKVIVNLSKQLTALYGNSLDATNLYKFLAFYKAFPILDTLCPKSCNLLSWSHYRTLLQVSDPVAREWYLNEATEQTWSVRTLQRNISSQYYQRMLMSQHKDVVEKEMLEITRPLQDRLEFIKNPVIAEFLGMSPNTDFTETELEKAILNNIQKFLM